MDRSEKKRNRNYIGEHLEISNARLTDDEAGLLMEFINTYDDAYKGRIETRSTTIEGWNSDGKYTRRETFTDTFTDDITIREDYEYQDDDGQRGESTNEIKDARGILNWLRERG